MSAPAVIFGCGWLVMSCMCAYLLYRWHRCIDRCAALMAENRRMRMVALTRETAWLS